MTQVDKLIEEGRVEEALKLAIKEDIAILNRLGVELAKKRDPLALKIFSRIIKLNPNDTLSYYNRGNVYRDLNQQKKAIKDYAKAIKLNPGHASTYINKGNSYTSLKQYSRAIANYQMALNINPNDNIAYNNLKIAQTCLNQRKNRAINTENALKKKVISGLIVIAILSSVFMFAAPIVEYKIRTFTTPVQTEHIEEETELLVKELGYDDEAARYVACEVNNWTDFWGRPVLYIWEEELTDAREKYGEAKLIRIETKITRKLGKKIKKEIPEYETNKWNLENVIRDKEANCVGYTQLFFVLGDVVGLSVEPINVRECDESSSHGDFDFRWMLDSESNVIKTHIVPVVNLSDESIMFVELSTPSSSPVVSKPLILGRRYEKDGNYLDAKYRYDPKIPYTRIRMCGKDGLIASVHNSRGCSYRDMWKCEMAISEYTKAMEIDPKNVNAYNNRGSVYASTGEYLMAISDCTKAIGIDPKFAASYYNRGRIYGSLGEYRKAISDFTKAIELDSDRIEVYYDRGLAYYMTGEYEEAVDDYTDVIDSIPFGRHARERRKDAFLNRGRAYLALGEEQKAKMDFDMAGSVFVR